MPCPRCGNKVTMSTVTHNIWFCKCGLCNVCHPSGIYWNQDQYGVPHWYQRSRTPGSIKPFIKYNLNLGFVNQLPNFFGILVIVFIIILNCLQMLYIFNIKNIFFFNINLYILINFSYSKL